MGLKRRVQKSGYEVKTKPQRTSVDAFLKSVEDGRRRRDGEIMLAMMKDITGKEPIMWGSSIVGFGQYTYTNRSGHVDVWPRTGFSPRKQALTVYLMPGFGQQGDLLSKLGRHKKSVSCLYLPSLDDVDLDVLRAMVERSLVQMARTYPDGA